ncbi:hypothetical protein ALC62_15420 [Cyphomyrmex costatus]|uniref:Uncharacterized protein n=1 Tax=Cyphomyrmex costatus TaxID=456900 RepID=A0A151I728_9HYME|nr:hypothetical protein ALC62_15420 [Cyphomyrmex costatus]
MLKRTTTMIHYKFFVLNSRLEMLPRHSRTIHETINSILRFSSVGTYRGLIVRDNSQKLRSRAIDSEKEKKGIECERFQLVSFFEDSLKKSW